MNKRSVRLFLGATLYVAFKKFLYLVAQMTNWCRPVVQKLSPSWLSLGWFVAQMTAHQHRNSQQSINNTLGLNCASLHRTHTRNGSSKFIS